MQAKGALAIGYVKARDGASAQDLERAIREWAEPRGYLMLGVFVDVDVDGNSDGAPTAQDGGAFASALRYCADNDVRTLMVSDLSSLGDSLAAAQDALRRLFDSGLSVVFVRHGLRADPQTTIGKAVLSSLSMASELTSWGIGYSHQSEEGDGRRAGRPPKSLDEEELLALHSRGLSVRAIAKSLGVSKSTVWRKLKDVEHQKRLISSGREG